jgi:copper(I)-binding protein
MKPVRWLALLSALAVVLAACGGSDVVSVENQWSRTSPNMTTAGVAYFEITASETDRLIGAAVDPSIAAKVELHETSMNDEGAMMMQPVPAIDLPAGETVKLEPGGLHIMLMQLTEPLETGQTYILTLQFAESDDQEIEVEVREEAP